MRQGKPRPCYQQLSPFEFSGNYFVIPYAKMHINWRTELIPLNARFRLLVIAGWAHLFDPAPMQQADVIGAAAADDDEDRKVRKSLIPIILSQCVQSAPTWPVTRVILLSPTRTPTRRPTLPVYSPKLRPRQPIRRRPLARA